MGNQEMISAQQTGLTRLPDALQATIKTIDQYIQNGQMTINTAIKGKQLSRFTREYGKKDMLVVVSAWVMLFAKTLNIGKNIDSIQAVDIADAILKECWYLKLAEIALFFEKAKNGEFGKLYDRVDRAVIFEWLTIFENQRMEAIELMHSQIKSDPDTIHTSEWVMKKLRETDPDAKYFRQHIPSTTLRDHLTDPAFKKQYYQEYVLPDLIEEEKEAAKGEEND